MLRLQDINTVDVLVQELVSYVLIALLDLTKLEGVNEAGTIRVANQLFPRDVFASKLLDDVLNDAFWLYDAVHFQIEHKGHVDALDVAERFA